jgi:hypothetical protein
MPQALRRTPPPTPATISDRRLRATVLITEIVQDLPKSERLFVLDTVNRNLEFHEPQQEETGNG